MNGLQVSRADIEECQEIVNNFRVNELNLLLTSYHYPKLGKKQDLVQRAKSLLTNPKYQLSAVQKIREIHACNRLRQVPYNLPNPPATSTNPDMRRQQFLGNPNSVSRSAMLHQAVNTMGQPFAGGANQPNSGFPMFNHFPGAGATSSMYNAFGYPSQTGGNGNISGQARNLRTVTLPFYDLKSIVIPLTELPSFNIQPRPGEARHLCQFGFAPDEIARLYYKSDDKPLPRYEIQFRMFLLDTTKEQEDAFPPGCIVKLDDYNVTLPNVIPTNKPNAEQKRLSRPVNITPYCQPPRPRDRPHRMMIEWSGDKRAWAFGIFFVFRVNAEILQERLLQNVAARRSFQNTKSIIIKRLNGDDDDGIEMDSLKISLLCPLMRTRIKLPARAVDCTHLQFFDLTNYLMMCEKRPVWKCPVCDNQAFYSKLIIDQYFQKVIESTDTSVDDVELLKDGTWRVFKEEMVNLSEDDNEDIVVATTSKKRVQISPKHDASVEAPASASNTAPASAPDCDVITLSDSSDDEDDGMDSRVNEQVPQLPSDAVISRQTSEDKDSCDSSRKQSTEREVTQNKNTTLKPNNNSKFNDSDVIMLSDSDNEDEDSGKGDSVGTSAAAQKTTSDNENARNREPVANGLAAAVAAVAASSRNQSTEKEATTTVNGVANAAPRNGTVPSSAQHPQNHTVKPPSTGIFQSNGFNPPVFRPVIDEVAKTHVAKELASFLQSVCAKNSLSSASFAANSS